MSLTKVTSNIIEDNAALDNLNAGATITFTKNVSTTGSISGSSISTNGTISGDSATLSGGLSADTVTTSGDITADGNISGDNISYDADSDTNTVGGDLEVVGQLTAPNQVADSDESVLTKSTLKRAMLQNFLGIASLFSGSSSSGGSNQFARDSGGFFLSASTSVAGLAAAVVNLFPPNVCRIGENLGNRDAGSGPIIDLNQSHLIKIGIIPERGNVAFDTLCRFSLGTAPTVSPSYVGTLRGLGYGFSIRKNPTENYFDLRLNIKTGRGTINNASNTTPIVITTSTGGTGGGGHGLNDGDLVEITNVLGNTNANGFHTIERISSTQFILLDSQGNGEFATSDNAGFQKTTIETFPLLPNVYHDIYLIWNAEDSSLSAMVNDLKNSPDLIIEGGNNSIPILVMQVSPILLSYGSVTYDGGSPAPMMHYSAPHFYRL